MLRDSRFYINKHTEHSMHTCIFLAINSSQAAPTRIGTIRLPCSVPWSWLHETSLQLHQHSLMTRLQMEQQLIIHRGHHRPIVVPPIPVINPPHAVAAVPPVPPPRAAEELIQMSLRGRDEDCSNDDDSNVDDNGRKRKQSAWCLPCLFGPEGHCRIFLLR